jgi:hypothetical protein
MIISKLDKSRQGELVRISAEVRVESADNRIQTVFIETESQFVDALTLNTEAFVVGCLVPAMHFNESRMVVEGDISPTLREGLDHVMALLSLWTAGRLKPLSIDAGDRTGSLAPQPLERAGLFLSGGIDSLCALRVNRKHYPLGHPDSVKDCLLVHGFDIGGVMERGAKYHVFERAKAHMAVVADDADVVLIPVYTNIRHLCDQRELWLNSFFGAVLAAVGHAFAARLDRVFIASSYDLASLHPCGSHPLLDPAYSSTDLMVRHKDVHLSRLQKHRIVSQWDAAFQNFRVCLANTPDRLNCGVCEKCTRTRTELLALGLLHKTRAFVEDDVTPEDLLKYDITIRGRDIFYREMIPPLLERGRDDLVDAIRTRLGTAK